MYPPVKLLTLITSKRYKLSANNPKILYKALLHGVETNMKQFKVSEHLYNP